MSQVTSRTPNLANFPSRKLALDDRQVRPGEDGMQQEFCPQCGAGRQGTLQFCRSCGFDFDAPRAALPDPETVPEALATPSAAAAPSVGSSPRRGWIILGSVIFVAIVAAAAFISLSGSGALLPKHDIGGSFTLTATGETFHSPCSGTGGYSDIRSGTNVVLKDGDGKLLSTGSLGSGAGSGNDCVFEYSLNDVPEVPFYTIEVGKRGDLSYSLADMKSMGWSVDLTLGS